jgi:hypothetical protein
MERSRYYLIFLNHQGVLFNYTQQIEFLESHEWIEIFVLTTLRAGLIHTALSLVQIESQIHRTGFAPHDRHKVFLVSDFDFPSAVPADNATLQHWLKQRHEWVEFSQEHS